MVGLLLASCTVTPPEDPVIAPVDDPAGPPMDPGDAMVAYRLAFPDGSAHRIAVEAGTRCPDAGVLQWWMPVWTPGSYLVREYARHVETIAGSSEAGPLPLRKIAKNRWAHPCTPGEGISLAYELYAREMTVRTSFVDAEMGIVNGAATFVLPDLGRDRPIDLTIALPEGWEDVQTALPPHPEGDPHRFLAPDVDTLVDSPLILGNLDVRTFDVDGTPHHVATVGHAGAWDHAGVAADTERIVAAHADLWGRIPYDSYRFLVVLGEARGGLEHLDSTLMITSRWNTALREDRLQFYGLVSHEFFHTWNGKRLRPVGLGPFDYEAEVHTPSLWIVEGITSYYDDLLLARAGLMDEAEYLEALGRSIVAVQGTPGREVQSLSEASFDAWIKYYRWNENSNNSTISYYTKGAVVAWLLDAEIRRGSSGRRSLDDLMRLAWAREGDAGYTTASFRALASEVAERDLTDFFARYVDRAEDLDYGSALQWWGLRFAPVSASDSDDPTPGWIGAKTADREGRLVVTGIPRNTPAWRAGLTVDDEIVALDDERVTPSTVDDKLHRFGADHTGTLLVARRGRLVRLEVILGTPPTSRWRLEVDPGASPIAASRRSRWIDP